MAIGSRNKVNMNFSMSGMTDIVFLLLIFFMIVSTLIVPGTSDVNLPHSNNQTVATPNAYVSITADKKYYFDGEVVAFEDLESRLASVKGTGSEPPTIRLNADESLNMDQVFNFLEIAKRNKFKVILGTRPL
jgi:biopolymer transport protein ExbD